MGNLNLLGTGKSSGKTRVVGMKAYDMNMNEVPMDKELPRGRYVVVSVIEREHPTYPYIARFFCITVGEDGNISGEEIQEIALETPDVPMREIGIAVVNCEDPVVVIKDPWWL